MFLGDLFLSFLGGLFILILFYNSAGGFPLEFIGIRGGDYIFISNVCVFAIPMYFFLRKGGEKASSEDKKEDISNNYESPLEVMTFGSINNLFTAGNNMVSFDVRNNGDIPRIFDVELEVNGKWKPTKYNQLKISGKDIKRFEILGPAWGKATSCRITNWR